MGMRRVRQGGADMREETKMPVREILALSVWWTRCMLLILGQKVTRALNKQEVHSANPKRRAPLRVLR